MGYILLILGIAIIAVSLYLGEQGKKTLRQNVQIIDRESSFYTKKETFFANVSYKKITDALLYEIYGDDANRIISGEKIKLGMASVDDYKTGKYVSKGISFDENVSSRVIHFKGGGRYPWTATFAQINEKPEGNTFEFSFNSWKTRNGSADDVGMNYLLTAIEKGFLKCDMDTVFELKEENYKTRYI